MALLSRKSIGQLAAFFFASMFATASFAAGSVAMQIEHLVRQSVEEYNSAMEESDSSAYLKYFASNAKYESPLFSYSGRAQLARHFDSEFKTFKARFKINKMFIQDSSAAIVLTWDAVDRASGDAIKLEMVGLFEVGSSGQFSSAVFYFDSAKAQALAKLAK